MGQVHKYRSNNTKLEALSLVFAGFKQVAVGRLMDIPDNTISGWIKRETALVERAKDIGPRAVKKARRSIKARKGGLARWGKLDPMPVPPAKGTPKRKEVPQAKKSRAMSEETKQKLRDHWAKMDPDEKRLRVDLMHEPRSKKKA